MNKFTLRSFDLSKEKDVLEFTTTHPWKPRWSQKHIKEFLRLLTSNNDMVFDLFSNKTRIATAVLIDNIQNKGNNACLEILGLDKKCDLVNIYRLILKSAKEKLPKNRNGIEITIQESLKELTKLLNYEGFSIYYDTYEMTYNTKISNRSESVNIIPLIKQDSAECYKVMVESLSDNPDHCILTFEDWKSSHQESKEYNTWVYKEDDRIKGFLSLFVHSRQNAGEIRTIGVLPNQRGKGIGRKLLSFGINYIVKQGISRCDLTVATNNQNALGLYLNLGFEIINHYTVYCWKINEEVCR